MKPLLNTISIALFFCTIGQCGIMDWWYTYDDDNMSIIFPCTYSSNNENYGNGMETKMVSCVEDNMNFGVAIMSFPNPYGKSMRDALQSAVKMGSQAGKKLYQKEISLNGYLGIEYLIRIFIDGGYVSAFTRIYYIKGKVYSLKILYMENDYNKSLLDDFFISFKPEKPF